MKKSIILALVASFVAFTSCNNSDDDKKINPVKKRKTRANRC